MHALAAAWHEILVKDTATHATAQLVRRLFLRQLHSCYHLLSHTQCLLHSLVPWCDECHHPQWLPPDCHPELIHAHVNGAVLTLIKLLS